MRKSKYIKTRLSDFLSYLKGEMSGEERNSFERELQKDPFAEEAAEGLSAISPDEVSEDIRHLQDSVYKRTRRKQRHIYRIAASIAVLMIVSSVFIVVERNKPSEELSEISKPVIEIRKVQPLNKPEQQYKQEERTERHLRKAEVSDDARMQKSTVPAQPVQEAPEATGRIARSEIFVEEDTGNKKSFAPSGSSKGAGATIEERQVNSDYTPPRPVNGMTAFEKYVHENIHNPDTLTEGQRVVVVRFIVKTDGTVSNIRILSSPGKKFSDEAIRLIKSGPAWIPAEQNGIVKEDETSIRIAFR